MPKSTKLWKQTGHYLAGRIALMVLGLVSFPLLTRLLTVSQYGELSLLLKLSLFWSVLSKAGMQNAATRIFPEQASQGPLRASICGSTLLLESCLLSGLSGLFALAVLHVLSAHLPPGVVLLAPIVLALVWVRSVQPVVSGLLRSEGRTAIFNACEIFGRACGVGLSVAVLTFYSRGLGYYLFSLLMAEGLVLIALIVWLRGRGFLSLRAFDWRLATRALTFSAPLIGYELASVLLDSGDRILIARYLDLVQVGLYSAAYSIATYAEEALMMPVNMALMPAYMKVWLEDGAEATTRFLSQAFDAFYALACAVLMVTLLCSEDLISLLASSKFSAAHRLLPVLVAGLLIYALHIFFNAPLIIYRKSIVLSAITALCLLLNVGLNIVLIPTTGIMGSAVATLLSYLAMVVSLAIVSRRYLAIAIPMGRMAISTCAAGLSYLTFRMLHVPWLPADLICKMFLPTLAYLGILCAARSDWRTAIRSRLHTGTDYGSTHDAAQDAVNVIAAGPEAL